MKRHFLIVLSFILLGVETLAQVPPPVDPAAARAAREQKKTPAVAVSLSRTELELGYNRDFSHPDYLNRDLISTAEMAPMSLLHIGLESVTGNSIPPIKLGASLAAAIFDRAILHAGHEYGHLSAFSKAGYTDWRYDDGINLTRQLDKDVSPSALFSDAFPSGDITVGVSESEWNDIDRRFGRGRDYYEFSAAMEAGGLNQSEATRVNYRDRLLEGRFGLYDTVPYFGGTFSTLLYSSASGDLIDYVGALDAYGVHTSEGSVRLISLARFASGSSWAALGSYVQSVAYGDSKDLFQPMTIDAWSGRNWTAYYPEFESWLSRRGPTVKAMLPIRHTDGGWFFPSIEQSVAGGGMATEIGGYLKAPISSNSPLLAKLYAFANTEGGLWLEPGIGIKAADWLVLDLAGYWGNGYTFHRDIYGATYDFVDKAESGVKAGFTVFIKF